MDIRTWTGTRLLLAIVAYWVVLGLGWFAYVRRPGLAERQEAARAAPPVSVTPDGHGGWYETYEFTVDLTPAIVLIVVPPALATIVWLLGSRI